MCRPFQVPYQLVAVYLLTAVCSTQHAANRDLAESVWSQHILCWKYFDVHVTVHSDKFPVIKPSRCTDFSNLFLEWNSTCFGKFLCPLSGVCHCTHTATVCHTGLLTAARSCQQTCMTYTTAVCTVTNSWWWTEKLSKTCRISFQKQIREISASTLFYYRKSCNYVSIVNLT